MRRRKEHTCPTCGTVVRSDREERYVDFSALKKGTIVKSKRFGLGVISSVSNNISDYPVAVYFKKRGFTVLFTADGKDLTIDKKPDLSLIDNINEIDNL